MGKFKNLFKNLAYSALIAGSMFLFNQDANAQKRIKSVDPLFYSHYLNTSDSVKAGIPAYYILQMDSRQDTLQADSTGLILDTLKPSLLVNVSNASPVESSKVVFTANASDLNGIYEVNIYHNNNLIKTCNSGLCESDSAIVTAGLNTYYAIAKDNSFFRNQARDPLSGTKNFTGKSLDTTIQVNVNNRWNLIGLPLSVKNAKKTSLFPTSSSLAYKYNEAYLEEDTLRNFIGYWLKFNSAQNINITGRTLEDSLVNVNDGWNIISVGSKKVLADNISSIPENIILSEFFGYDGNYFIEDTLKPGKGYWVKTLDGSLILTNSFKRNLENILNEMPPNPPSENINNNNLNAYILNNVLNIEFLNDELNLTLYDILGRKVKEINNKDRINLDLNRENLSNGTYAYVVNNDKGFLGNGLIINFDNYSFLKRTLLGKALTENNNAEKEFRENSDNIEKSEVLSSPIRLIVKDELTDSVGNYYDYDSLFASVDEIPNLIPLFPGSNLLEFSHPRSYGLFDSTSALSFLRWFAYSDKPDTSPYPFGSYFLNDYVEDQPLKVFANRVDMPNSNYEIGFDSSIANWEQVTSFLYRGVMLNSEDLFVEVQTNPDTGIKFKYDEDHNYTFYDNYYPQPFIFTPPVIGPSVHTTITIRNTFPAGGSFYFSVKKSMNHEIKHNLFKYSDSFRENPDPTDDDFYVKSYFGKLKKVTNSLQRFFPKGLPRLGVYKED